MAVNYFTAPIHTVALASIRETPPIKRFLELRDSHSLNMLKLSEAVALADALISQVEDAAGTELGIGGQVDIATIETKKGFTWVPGHEPARKK
jgi:hypothetical protein